MEKVEQKVVVITVVKKFASNWNNAFSQNKTKYGEFPITLFQHNFSVVVEASFYHLQEVSLIIF